MKKILLAVSILCLFFLIAVYRNNNNPKLIIYNLLDKCAIKNGDLVYQASFFNIFPIGEGVFSVEKAAEYGGNQVYYLTARAKTQKSFSKFFQAQAFLESFVDIRQKHPLTFRQKIQVTGKKDIVKEINYDQKNHTMTLSGVRRSIFPDTQDPLSAMLNIKTMDFDKISEFEMNINTNQKNYLLKGRARPKEITLCNKTYKAFILEATISRRDKNPYHKSRVTMVLLKDTVNIPVSIKVFSNGALINAKLIEIR